MTPHTGEIGPIVSLGGGKIFVLTIVVFSSSYILNHPSSIMVDLLIQHLVGPLKKKCAESHSSSESGLILPVKQLGY